MIEYSTDVLNITSSQVLLNYSEMLQKKFLLFTTGSDRVPVGGMQEMTFKISKLKVRCFIKNIFELNFHYLILCNFLFQDKTNFLPEAHTCFNQLVLPDYKNKVFINFQQILSIDTEYGTSICYKLSSQY